MRHRCECCGIDESNASNRGGGEELEQSAVLGRAFGEGRNGDPHGRCEGLEESGREAWRCSAGKGWRDDAKVVVKTDVGSKTEEEDQQSAVAMDASDRGEVMQRGFVAMREVIKVGEDALRGSERSAPHDRIAGVDFCALREEG